MLDTLHDLAVACRRLGRRPGFTLLVAVTLGVGVGAAAAVFGVVRGVLLEPLPYRDAERVVTVWSRWERFPKTWVSEDEARLYRREMESLEDLALYWSPSPVSLGGERVVRVDAAFTSAGVLSVLGVEPVLGRGFTAEEDRDEAAVVMIGHDLWQRRFGGREGAIGATLEIEGQAREVIGVLPPGVRLPEEYRSGAVAELWLPLGVDLAVAPAAHFAGGDHNFYAVGRLAPEATAEALSTELTALATTRTRDGVYPAEWSFTAFALPVRSDVLGEVGPALVVAAGAVGFVLLLAAANVVHLLFLRLAERRGEMAIRAALGAGRGRQLRAVAAETLLLASAGGVVAAAAAALAIELVRRFAPPGLPRIDELDGAGGVALLAFGLALAVGVALLVPPAARIALHGAAAGDLRRVGRGAVGGASRQRRALLVGVEMATAAVLLVGALLLVRSVEHLLAIDPGFRPEGALTFRIDLPQVEYPSGEKVAAFHQVAVDRLAALPGVEATGALRVLPLVTEIGDRGIRVDGYTPRQGESPAAEWQVVTPGSFAAMGTPLLAGRDFDARDRAGAEPVVIVDEAFAARYLAAGDAIGRRVALGGGPWARIVGVAGEVRHNGLLQPAMPGLFWPHSQFAAMSGFVPRGMTYVVRTAGDPAALLPAAQRAVAELDPALVVSEARTLAEAAATATAPSRFLRGVLVGFALLAVVLAAGGVYGVLAHTVASRTREIGVRLALGARPERVVRDVVGEGLLAVATGLGVGLLLAAWLVGYLGSVVHGVAPRDPATFTSALLVLLVVASLASALPARRAARVDPLSALRHE